MLHESCHVKSSVTFFYTGDTMLMPESFTLHAYLKGAVIHDLYVKRALVRWIQCTSGIPASWLNQCGVLEPGNASGGWLGHYWWTRKKVCFLTLVNQVNGPLGGRSRVPNGLIREEEGDDGNEQLGDEHRRTHLRFPPSGLQDFRPLSCQGHTHFLGASLVKYIQQATSLPASQSQRWNVVPVV